MRRGSSCLGDNNAAPLWSARCEWHRTCAQRAAHAHGVAEGGPMAPVPTGPVFALQVSGSPGSTRPGEGALYLSESGAWRSSLRAANPAWSPRGEGLCGVSSLPPWSGSALAITSPSVGARRVGWGGAPALLETHLWGAPGGKSLM